MFPTSIQRGMFFKDAHEVRTHIVKEAIDKGIPMNIYKYRQSKSWAAFTCKICRSALNFCKREKGFEATTLQNEHLHGKDEIAGYKERKEKDRRNHKRRTRLQP